MLFEYETKRLILRIIEPGEAADVLDFYLRDKELFEKYEPERIAGFYTLKRQEQIINFELTSALRGSLFRYYVYRKQARNQIIGTICFHHIQGGYSSSCEIGYKFSSAHQHRGYATEALVAVTQAIFSEMKLHRITAFALPDNVASARLLARAGFCYEGICRDYLFLQGAWRDHAQYSLISP